MLDLLLMVWVFGWPLVLGVTLVCWAIALFGVWRDGRREQ